jgi:hypothetical protein
MKIYISGPISGMPDGNVPAFIQARAALRSLRYQVRIPFDNKLTHDHTWEQHMRADIKMLMDCNAVCMLPGWENSRGANIERQLAVSLGMQVKTLAEWLA